MTEPWMPDRWLTPAAASRRAGVTTPTLIEWTRTRGLVFRRENERGQREYSQRSLDALAAEGRWWVPGEALAPAVTGGER